MKKLEGIAVKVTVKDGKMDLRVEDSKEYYERKGLIVGVETKPTTEIDRDLRLEFDYPVTVIDSIVNGNAPLFNALDIIDGSVRSFIQRKGAMNPLLADEVKEETTPSDDTKPSA